MSILFYLIAIFAGFVYASSREIIAGFANLNLFYTLSIAIVALVFVFKSSKKQIKREDFYGKNPLKIVAIFASFIIVVLNALELVKIMESGLLLISMIVPALAVVSAFCFLKFTVYLDRGVEDYKNHIFIVIPMFWLVFEVLMLFKDNSSNPILSEYVIALLSVMATTITVYMVAAIFASDKKKSYFNQCFFISSSLSVASVVSVLLSTNTQVLNTNMFSVCVVTMLVNAILLTYKVKVKS